MCGLFGASDLNKLNELAILNQHRGGIGSSLSMITDKVVVLTGSWDELMFQATDAAYYVGHHRAPTSQTPNFHPAIDNHAYLWHNGIIKQSFLREVGFSGWDTEYLLTHIDSLSSINGSFACCYFNEGLYVFRNEIAPLFTDGSSFSSMKFSKAKSIEPNVFYEYALEGFIRTSRTFTTFENPYYFG